jgi:hypothetical protein
MPDFPRIRAATDLYGIPSQARVAQGIDLAEAH